MRSEVLTIKDVAEQMRVSVRTAQNWVRSGKLEAFRVGRVVRIDREPYRLQALRDGTFKITVVEMKCSAPVY